MTTTATKLRLESTTQHTHTHAHTTAHAPAHAQVGLSVHSVDRLAFPCHPPPFAVPSPLSSSLLFFSPSFLLWLTNVEVLECFESMESTRMDTCNTVCRRQEEASSGFICYSCSTATTYNSIYHITIVRYVLNHPQ